MASSSSILAAIKNDHADLKDAYQKYLSAEDNIDEQQRWANQFRWELARHTVSEELIIFPALEKYLGTGGKKMADEDRTEHHEIKGLLHLLETSAVTDSYYRSVFEKLMANFTEHIKWEETDVAKLEKVITPEHSASMARSYERTKMFAPTKAHPDAPNETAFETAVGLMAAPFDKLRDMFEKFPDTK